MTAALVALGLLLLAGWDLYGLLQARQRRVAAVVGGLWAVAIALAVLRMAGVPLPTLASVLLRLTRPVAPYVP